MWVSVGIALLVLLIGIITIGLWLLIKKSRKKTDYTKIRKIVYSAIIAALYTTVSVVFAPISFGIGQLRVAEAMTILPILSPSAIWGLALGCAVTNFIGMTTGASILGAADIVLGTCATIIAAFMTYAFRKRRIKRLPVLSTLPPVFVNAIVVGAELCFVMRGTLLTWEFFIIAGSVALGQLGACTGLGLILSTTLEKTKAADMLRNL